MTALRRALLALLIPASAGGTLPAQQPPPTAGPATAAEPAASAARYLAMRWTDVDGKPLPFQSEDELIAFLKTADVKSQKPIGAGTTQPFKLVLEKDGVSAHAVFRYVNEEQTGVHLGGGVSDLFFRDSYVYEPAAYELSRFLGLDDVPPATLRKVNGKNGSVQIWVENSMTEIKRIEDKIQPPDVRRWNKQLQQMNVFDALIYNTDRNRGNMLIDRDWKLWMIDHTRAFRRVGVLQNAAAVRQCERGMYEKLKSMDEAAARKRLEEFLSPNELDALFKRRKLLLAHIDKLIAENGEAKVLYVDTEDRAPEAAAQ